VLWPVNYNYINVHRDEGIEVIVSSSEQIEVNETEMDEMGSNTSVNNIDQTLHYTILY